MSKMVKIDPNTGEEVDTTDTRIHFDYVKEPDRTQQSAKDECDINLIVAAAQRGAGIKHVNPAVPQYGDFTGLPDYKSALLMVNKASDMFMSLDAFVRERFGNDPGRLLDFLSDDKNRDEAIKLGLVKAPDAPPPVDPVVGELQGLRKDLSDSKSRKSKTARDEE